MIDMKDQCFGVEVEFTGITREQAAIALANYFGTTPRYKGGTYGTWVVRDTENKEWKLVSDASIQGERKTPDGYARTGDRNYWVEMVSPKLTCLNFRNVCGRCAMPAERSTTPAASMSTWTPPTITGRA